MLYIKHKDEGCGVICHKLKTNSPIKPQTLNEAIADVKNKNKNRQFAIDNLYNRDDDLSGMSLKLGASYRDIIKDTCVTVLSKNGFSSAEIQSILKQADQDYVEAVARNKRPNYYHLCAKHAALLNNK